MIKAVIFDLDDTLYSEWSFIRQGFCAVSRKLHTDYSALRSKHSINDIYKALEDIFFNKSRLRIFNYLSEYFDDIQLNENYIVKELVPIYRFSDKTLTCFSDVKSTLSQLQGNNKIGIVTNGNVRVQNNKIDLLGIRKYVDAIEISGDYPGECAKPSTFMLEKILKTFNIAPEESIYVGDNPLTDFSAIEFGCKFFRIVRKGGLYNDLSYDHCEYQRINNLVGLLTYIRN